MSSQSDGTHSFALERFGKSNNPTPTPTSTLSSTLSQEGASPETTKEQSTWTHVTTPNLTLQVVLQSNTDRPTPQTPVQQRPRPQASKASKQASYDNTGRSSSSTSSTAGTSSLSPFAHADQDTPRLVVQTGREILEYQRLDPASIGISKMKAMVKGSAMGFKLCHTSSPTLEIRKFQVKFRTTEDSARCASLLKKFIQCRNVLSTEGSEVIAVAEPQESTGDMAFLSLTPEDLTRALENIARDPSFPTLITRIEAIMRPRSD
ncbi:hypothetical protein CPB97_011880 [Podila verticillata]|nr:hypothetical protein CPB97_011880 [Podila verticillata]